ncbi:tRNA threonylcarbamoyladenosine biosynthesis protein TsaB [Buchnera aphidicola (Periphyllus testudinaceus)]|uniref:tRNA (adenosine(37)-N6)-threonylcarbamoyltransferase complex dimerization subunit type 1 TsaB n=1 Tax=Buchnera aphidicola TaxID=9 RepID=UPI003464425C
MKLLTFDNSQNMFSVAIKHKKKINYILKYSYKRNNSIILLMIDKILFRQSILLKNINYIAFSNGPGSFTGIRMSIMLAQGLSFGLKIKLIGISNLKILAYKARQIIYKKNFLIIIQANKKNVYWGKYIYYKNNLILKNSEKFISKKIAYKKLKILKKKWIIVKDFSSDLFKKIKKKNIILDIKNINALDIIPLALEYIQRKKTIKKNIIYPNYLNNIIIKK